MPFEIGQTVGSYRLIQQMGQGGMATVYKAYHAALDRYVAIKVLHPVFTEDASFLARFQREAKTVARMDHPNIVPIYDYAELEGRPYLVMKFIEGETLKARMARSALSREEILAITRAVGAALSYAHRNKILHRDIKPSNVLLSGDGQIYLADFGLARMAQSGESSLTADRLVGTPQYMSPEQALSKPDLDARTDIYSFGVMLYEMLVGRVPFNADTPFAVIHDHIYTPLPLPRQVKPDLPEAIERVLLKALAKNPDDRFADVTELVSAMEKAFSEAETIPLAPAESAPVAAPEPMPSPELSSEAVKAATIPSGEPPETPPKKHPKTGLVIGAAVVLLILLAFCMLVLIRFVQNRNPQRLKAPTLTAPIHEVATPAKPPENPPANREKALAATNAAIDAWKAKDLPGATRQMDIVREAAAGDRAIYDEVTRLVGEAKAPLLLLIGVFDPARNVRAFPQDAPVEMEVRRLAYRAAGDPLAGDYFQRNQNEPLLQVGSIRYTLLHGEPQQAKDRLGKLLEDNDFVKAFPETRLLEAELYAHAGDPAHARKTLDALLETPILPEWIRVSAQETLDRLPK